MKERTVRIGVNLENDSAEKFFAVKKHIGVKSNADIVRWLVNWYYESKGLQIEESGLRHHNLNENGVIIADTNRPISDQLCQIYFKPEGIMCEKCARNDCRHIRYALGVSKVKDKIRERRAQGWNLPEV